MRRLTKFRVNLYRRTAPHTDQRAKHLHWRRNDCLSLVPEYGTYIGIGEDGIQRKSDMSSEESYFTELTVHQNIAQYEVALSSFRYPWEPIKRRIDHLYRTTAYDGIYMHQVFREVAPSILRVRRAF